MKTYVQKINSIGKTLSRMKACYYHKCDNLRQLHYMTLQYITLRYITLHYITLHCLTLHYITLHYIGAKLHSGVSDNIGFIFHSYPLESIPNQDKH